MPEIALKNLKEATAAASVSALNKMAARIKTRISSVLREKYNIKKSDLDTYLHIRKATRIKLNVEITAGTKKIGIDHFGNIKQGTHGVVVEITRGKPVEIRVKPSATVNSGIFGTDGHGTAYHSKSNNGTIGTFIAKRAMGDLTNIGSEAVFARRGKKRYPLRRVVGPSAADLASSKLIQQIVQEVYNSDFKKIFISELKYYSSKQ